MTRNEILNLMSGFRSLLDPEFWIQLPRDPLTGLKLIGCVLLFFARDLVVIIVFPPDRRKSLL